MDSIGLKNRSHKINELFVTVQGLLFLDLNCDFQHNLALNFLNDIINDLPFLVPLETERTNFLKFLNYFRTNYLTRDQKYFLGKISNFQNELLEGWYPQLSNNVSESLNAVLNNIYKRGFINKGTCVEGIHTFNSDRRDKLRIFLDGNKAHKRKKTDLKRFQDLKFISQTFLSLISNPLNHFYPAFLSACFLKLFINLLGLMIQISILLLLIFFLLLIINHR